MLFNHHLPAVGQETSARRLRPRVRSLELRIEHLVRGREVRGATRPDPRDQIAPRREIARAGQPAGERLILALGRPRIVGIDVDLIGKDPHAQHHGSVGVVGEPSLDANRQEGDRCRG
ncbi:MAG: hypothetical protein IPH44_17690 [Myxococcales bacterium]|nr:hypothetical protein [Myxococcales bacterium]